MAQEKTKKTQKHLRLEIPIPMHSEVETVQAYRILLGEEKTTLHNLALEIIADGLTLPKYQNALTFKSQLS